MNSNGSNSSGDSNSMDDFNLSDDSDQSSRPSSSLSLHYLEDFHDANEKFDHEDVSNAEHSLDVDSMTREEFISYQRKLTYMERDAESERETMKTINLNGEGMQGVVPHLKLESTFTSRFGKVCVVFSSYAHKKLPSHGLRKGDNVGIYNGGVLCRDEYFCLDGIVLEVSSVEITVSLNEAYEFPPEGGYSIKHYPSLENVRRILQGLSDMLEARGPANHLAQVLFKEVQPLSPMPRLPPQICKRGTDELEFFNDNLDESQKSAVQFVLQQQDLAVVHGPPGTGKTTTLVEIIRQHVKMGVKVLAMAPSNQGVDNLVERLDDVGLKVVRIGHPARTTDATQRHTIDVLLHTSDGSEIILDIRREMRSLSQKLNSTPARERRAMHVELGKLRRELNERQERLSRSLVRNADVVLCTLLSASSHGQLRHLFWDHFGLTVIDECSQGTEASCYLGVLRSPKLVLAGDHKQLPPTVLCPEASYLLTSLMERIISTYGNTVVRMLTIQYRMHIDIMTWASNAMYDGNLVAHSSVEKQLLCQLPGVEHNLLTACPITLVDTSSSPGFEENDLPASAGQASSKSNDGEAELVLGQVSRLLKAGLRQDQVAVITPYSKQVKLVRSLVCGDFPGVEVQTVDGFQGREKEAVILTLVRSNNKGEIGFLAETRRLNVAVTRAKRHLSVVCDVATLRHNTFLSGFVDYMMDRANIVQAEHLDEDNSTTLCTDFSELDLSEVLVGCKPKVNIVKSQEQLAQEEEERKQKKLNKYNRILDKFVASSNRKHQFPSKLSSYDRMLIHDISEKRGLYHYSEGVLDKRHIVVSKEQKMEVVGEDEDMFESASIDGLEESDAYTKVDVETADINLEVEATVPKVEAVDPEKEVEAVDAMVEVKAADTKAEVEVTPSACVEKKHKKCSKKVKKNTPTDTAINAVQSSKHCVLCGKNIPNSNFVTHRLACEKNEREAIALQKKNADAKMLETEAQSIAANDIKKQQKQKKKKTAKHTTDGTFADVSTALDDFDAVVSSFTASNSRCNLPGGCGSACNTLMLHACRHCRAVYCLVHVVPEAHGCGDQARQDARATAAREGLSGPAPRLPRPDRRAQLKRALHTKLAGMEKGRKKKDK